MIESQADRSRSPRRLSWIVLLLLMGVALALRWRYIQEISLYVDEFYSIWAARQVLLRGLPILPSGDFYTKGLPFTYLVVPFVLGELNESVARIPGLLVSLATLPVAYWVGRRLFSERVGLIVAAVLAVDPDCIVWGARARMYGLLQLLTILVVYVYYRGLADDRPRDRYLAMGLLVAAIFTQAQAVLLLPALGLATLVAWPWRRLFRWSVVLPFAIAAAGAGIFLVISIFGQPGHLQAIQETRPYIDLSAGISSGLRLSATAFANRYRLPFALLVLGGLFFLFRPRFDRRSPLTYLYVVLLATLVLLVLLTGSSWRSTRFLFFLLPLFYLISGEILSRLLDLVPVLKRTLPWQPAILALLVALYMGLTGAPTAYWQEPGYDLAFRYLRDQRRPAPEDRIVTLMSPAAILYLGRNDAYVIQRRYETYVVARPEDGLPGDRWTASPLLTSTTSFSELLATAPRVWFIVDHSRFNSKYDLDFVMTVLEQMAVEYNQNDVVIFRGEGYTPPSQAAVEREQWAEFGEALALVRFGLSSANPHPGDELEVMLHWQALEKAGPAHTVSLHLLRPDGVSVADLHEPVLRGLVWPNRWPEDAVLADRYRLPLPADLPSGRYRLELEVSPSFQPDDLLPVGNAWHLPFASLTVGETSIPPPSASTDITFSEQLRLLGYDLNCEGEATTCELGLHWEAMAPVDRDYTVFVHLVDPDGAIATQHDAPPGDRFFPTSIWLPGEEVVDLHPLTLPADAPPGEYTLIVGLYHWPTGERLQAVDADGTPVGDAVPLTTIAVGEPAP